MSVHDKDHERIWLQGFDGEQRTWCQDKIEDDDTAYVRADIPAALLRARASEGTPVYPDELREMADSIERTEDTPT